MQHLRGKGEVHTGVWWGNLRERTSVEGRIILRWIFRKWVLGRVDWIDLAQDRDKWWVLVKAVTNLRSA
jgi:hypothetical protein